MLYFHMVKGRKKVRSYKKGATANTKQKFYYFTERLYGKAARGRRVKYVPLSKIRKLLGQVPQQYQSRVK